MLPTHSKLITTRDGTCIRVAASPLLNSAVTMNEKDYVSVEVLSSNHVWWVGINNKFMIARPEVNKILLVEDAPFIDCIGQLINLHPIIQDKNTVIKDTVLASIRSTNNNIIQLIVTIDGFMANRCHDPYSQVSTCNDVHSFCGKSLTYTCTTNLIIDNGCRSTTFAAHFV